MKFFGGVGAWPKDHVIQFWCSPGHDPDLGMLLKDI